MYGLRIAFAGKSRSGKTTSANYLLRTYGFVKISFTGKLIEFAHEFFPDRFEKGEKPQDLIQALHAKLREIDPDVWIKYVTRKIEMLPKDADIVIDDLRHRNDYAGVKALGFLVVRLDPSNEDDLPYDVLLQNEGTVEDLYHKLDALIKLLIAQKRSKA
jgi:hypothetical protein